MHDDLHKLLTREQLRITPTPIFVDAIRIWLQHGTGLIHPHGFYVFPLLRNSIEEWRLHVWPRGPRAISGMPAYIHTHDVNIDSKVLQAELTNIVYDVVEISQDGSPLYEVNYAGNKYSPKTSNNLCRTNLRVVARPARREVISCGEVYKIQRHTYHEAVISENIVTATLVCMHSRSSGKVKVIGLDGYPELISFKRKDCSGLETMDILSGNQASGNL